MKITRENLSEMITAGDARATQIIGRALVHIFNRQTEDEKKVNQTTNHNLVGFTPSDAHSGCIGAKYFLKHRDLMDWQIARWIKPNVKGVPRLAKYWRQLNEEAKKKEARQLAS